jgi:hypothetical protein
MRCEMTAQPSNCIQSTAFSPPLLSHFIFSLSCHRHLLRNLVHQHDCSAILHACAAMASRHQWRQPPPHLRNGITGDPKRSPLAQFIVNIIQLPRPGGGKRHWFTRRASQQSSPIGLAHCALHASSHPFRLRDCAPLALRLRVVSVNLSTVPNCNYDSMPPRSGFPRCFG